MKASQEAEEILESFGPAPHEFLGEDAYMRGEFESYLDRQKSKGGFLILAFELAPVFSSVTALLMILQKTVLLL